MTDRELEEVANAAAHKVVQELTKTLMGVDLDDPDSVREYTADLLFLRRQRKGAEEVQKWTKRSIVGIAISAIIWLLLQGLEFWKAH